MHLIVGQEALGLCDDKGRGTLGDVLDQASVPDWPPPRVNVHTSVATGVNARARTGSPVPIGGEPFRQGREHGHGRFWPLLQYGV